jgi:prevent-host-death family protein
LAPDPGSAEAITLRTLDEVAAERPKVGIRGAAKECVARRGVLATLVAMTVDGTMALRDVKNHLSEVVDQVEREHDRVVITKHGRPAAVVVSVDDLASLEETLNIAGRPQLMRQIRASLTELAAGEAEMLTKDEILRTLSA